MSKMSTNLDTESDLQVALNDFSLKFLQSYHRTTGDKHSNLFYSPISLASALSLLLSGADGTTRQELVDLLGYNDLLNDLLNAHPLEVAFKKLKEDFKRNTPPLFKLNDSANDCPLFKMANRVYFRADTRLQDEFRRISKEAYEADLLEVDFGRNSAQLVNEINQWIELETKNKIQNAFKRIDADTVMLLINVVYFKGKWRKPMKDVYPKEFTNMTGKKKQVDTMCDLDDYPFGQFEHYAILQLDYIGNCSMYIVLPNEQVNLHDLLLELNARKLNEHLRELKSTNLDLQLPKFKLKTEINLKSVLQQLGVETLFNQQANLSKILNEGDLMVTKAVQNAFIEVDEAGTEAAAVTYETCDGFGFGTMTPVPKFHVNRPFIFLIRLNGVNIFVGALKQF